MSHTRGVVVPRLCSIPSSGCEPDRANAKPHPTAAPTCDPATKPNSTNCSCTPPIISGGTPQWSCFCFVTGAAGFSLPGRPPIIKPLRELQVTAVVRRTCTTTPAIAARALSPLVQMAADPTKIRVSVRRRHRRQPQLCSHKQGAEAWGALRNKLISVLNIGGCVTSLTMVAARGLRLTDRRQAVGNSKSA